MNQESTALTPSIPPASKKWTWKETLTVVSLILFPLAGLILMWLIANWSKRAKVIITIALLIMSGILAWTQLVNIEETIVRSRDVNRKANMRSIEITQMAYWAEEEHYYQSEDLPVEIPYYSVMPTDPLDTPPYIYVWVDNTGDPQKFCVYATLEAEEAWSTASHRGSFECTDARPTLEDCCFEQ